MEPQWWCNRLLPARAFPDKVSLRPKIRCDPDGWLPIPYFAYSTSSATDLAFMSAVNPSSIWLAIT